MQPDSPFCLSREDWLALLPRLGPEWVPAALLEAVARKGKAAQDNATAVVLAVEEGGRET